MVEKASQPTILLVDDQEYILTSLARILQSMQCNILSAKSGAEGLGLLEQHDIDLVVSDMYMPAMDGIAFLEQVSEHYPQTVRVLITGLNDLTSTIEAVNKGHIYKYIRKPWVDEELRAALHQSLKYKRLSDEREELFAITQAQNKKLRMLNNDLDDKIMDRDRLAAELNNELKQARMVQESLLPSGVNHGLPLVGFNVPARHLSGDFYDYFLRDDGRIYFNLGDVSGKGANAALLMVKVSSLFRCLAKDIHEPDELLFRLNQELCENSSRGMFVTMVAGIYEPNTRHLSIVNAGHIAPVIMGHNHYTHMEDAEALPLGILSGETFPVDEFTLGNSSLYIFSDGLVERVINGQIIMDIDSVVAVCREFRRLPMEVRLQAIVEQLRVDTIPSHDDMTIVLLEDVR